MRKGQTPKRFWKIRDKSTEWFVTKSRTYRPWLYQPKDQPDRFDAMKKYYTDKDGYNEYAECGTVGKTYSTLAGAKRMMLELAHQIQGGRESFCRAKLTQSQVFELTSPYFELVEYEITEVKIIDS